jgi:hypothetical protein
MAMTKYQILSRRIGAFAKSRDWAPFRTPKNTAMTLGVEAGALAEHFLWLTQELGIVRGGLGRGKGGAVAGSTRRARRDRPSAHHGVCLAHLSPRAQLLRI